MAKTTKKQDKKEGQTDRWIEEENLKSQAMQIKARIRETAQKAEADFWEIITGSFPEVANMRPPTEVAGEFSKACRDAVTAWYIANTELDEKLRGLITTEAIRKNS